MFSRASSSVSPSDQQPGRLGTETLIPSSVRCRTTLYLMGSSRRDIHPVPPYPFEHSSTVTDPQTLWFLSLASSESNSISANPHEIEQAALRRPGFLASLHREI